MEEFDYLVLGGGSAGSVVASRLSENPGVSVALLEAGGQGSSWVVNTPVAGALMVPTPSTTGPSKRRRSRASTAGIGYQPRGKALGGSSAINAMVYIRGHRARLRSLGRAGQPRLVLCRRVALFQEGRSATRISATSPRQGRPAQCRRTAHRQPYHEHFHRRRARGAASHRATTSTAKTRKASASTR